MNKQEMDVLVFSTRTAPGTLRRVPLFAGFAFSARGQLPDSPRATVNHTQGKEEEEGRRGGKKFENALARSETLSGEKKKSPSR